MRYQGYGRTRIARALARLLPSFASGLIIVARVPAVSGYPGRTGMRELIHG